MEPSSTLIATVTGNGDEETDQQHQADQDASAASNANHSPINLPSANFLTNRISKSVARALMYTLAAVM